MKLIARNVGPDSATQMADMLSTDEEFERVVRGMSVMAMNARGATTSLDAVRLVVDMNK